MFVWKNKYAWGFQEGGIIDSVGPNEADTGIFEGHPYRGLAKEILQNSLDAKDPLLPDTDPVIVEFSCIDVPVNEIPGMARLNEVIELCAEFFNKGDDGQKLQRWKKKANGYVAADTIPVLKISDYNTTGLDGVTEVKGTNWSTLVRQKGATNKGDGQGGSHGVGKFAPYSFSSIRTVLYSTQNTAGETAFQGKTILTSFEENGKSWLNIGVFGNTEDPVYPAVFDMNDVPEPFRRTRNGTDVIAVGFEHEDGWVDQIAISVLQYCFYAIYDGKLIVRIRDENNQVVELNQINLDDQMSKYEQWYEQSGVTAEFKFSAPKYLRVLRSPLTKHFEEEFYGRGKVELYLAVDHALEGKSVYEMRRTGMQIQEDTGWRIGAHFHAIFIATGKGAVDKTPQHNIDSFLRKCEDQAHNEWTAAFYKDHAAEAAKVIANIHKWILSKVKDEMPDLSGTTHDAFGLDQFIQNNFSVGNNTQEEDAFNSYEPLSFEMETVENKAPKNVTVTVKANGKGKNKSKGQKKGNGSTGGNKNPNNKRGKKTGKTVPVDISRVKTPYNSLTGQYAVSFVAEREMEKLSLLFSVNSDDQNNEYADIKTATVNGSLVKTHEGRVAVGKVRKGQKIEMTLELENKDRRALEVTAYVEQ